MLWFRRFLNGYKNRTKVEVPFVLYPKDIMANSSKYGNKVYKLNAAILHVGGLQEGHYTATCFDYKSGKWVSYSDDRYR